MNDKSHLDAKYFIDRHVYNCPYCNRNNVAYRLSYPLTFNWSNSKECYVYFATCDSCNKKSMHLSFNELDVIDLHSSYYRFHQNVTGEIDDNFFYSVPTSFFSLDNRIPKILRELITEAEGCLKSNYLTGASVCVRKLIYELAILEGATGDNYDERIKSLKEIRKDVDGEYFDTLLTIQQVTSDKVHEESYDGWSPKHLRLILSTVIEILGLMYVIPELRKEKRQSILALREDILGKPKDEA
ncbi:MAG: hypothetical protein RPU13_07645 [Candidatus Sedimenticola sp. (ex Thyasira tokunagai)]